MSEQSKLERIAIEQRENLLPRNYYNSNDGNLYSPTHTRAISDDETPAQGKGTGIYMDFDNGGSSVDKYGIAEEGKSGRTSNIAINDYNVDNGYDTPDMTGNVGQITY